MSEKYTQDDYKKDFPNEKDESLNDKSKRKRALEHALDIRKFEIELYWKRATYFWAFIASALVGYMTIKSANKPSQELLIILSSLGLVFSWAWVLVNKGSKYWQSNWEAHVDLLEDDITGPLYKVVLSKKESGFFNCLKSVFTGASAFSVSKINQLISIYVFTLWIFLFAKSLLSSFEIDIKKFDVNFSVILLAINILALILLYFLGKTSNCGTASKIKAKKRKTEIEPKE